ncbi:exopolyphosphatase [Colwellia sp. UCD-KL20]|uniref:exopolyphosphatase n=1 Tax=Colwellia sp. UCD-KL20 TaxID=1917165 RepID=UPI000970FEEA|nr:exopolyphosphatase [Colwellia sp. UCD-KL20]
MSDNKKYRLVTRSDFDGLVCAILLKHINLVDDILFVHPKDMQDGKIEVGANDISTNLPYVDGVHIAFDHHHSETIRNGKKDNHIIDPDAPSAARVVYDYYGGSEAFPASWIDMMEAVDKGDSAQFNMEEVLHAKGWELLNFIMDSRTGLGRFRDFRISNYELMMNLIDYGKDHNIDELLALPDVKERTDLYFEHEEKFKEQIKRCATVHGNLVVLDLREEDVIYSGNRFVIYALFPQCNISIHVMWGLKKQNTVFATGKSIFDRSSKTNVGELMLKYNGGGHNAAGTCQVPHAENEACLADLIQTINADG